MNSLTSPGKSSGAAVIATRRFVTEAGMHPLFLTPLDRYHKMQPLDENGSAAGGTAIG